MYVHSFTDANRCPSLFCACNRLLTQIGVPGWCACFFVFMCVCACTRLLTQIGVPDWCARLYAHPFTDANRCPTLVCVFLCVSARAYVRSFTDANRCPSLFFVCNSLLTHIGVPGWCACFCVFLSVCVYVHPFTDANRCPRLVSCFCAFLCVCTCTRLLTQIGVPVCYVLATIY